MGADYVIIRVGFTISVSDILKIMRKRTLRYDSLSY